MPFLMMHTYMLQQGLLCGLLLRRFVALWSFLLTGFLILIWSWLHIPCTKFALLVHHIVCYVHSEILSLMKSRPKSRLLAYECDFTIWDRCGWIGQGPSWYVWILGVRFQKGYLSPKMYQVVCKCEVCYHFRPLLSLYWSSFWTMENPHNHPSTSKDWSGPHERKMECCWSPEQNWIH